MAKKKALLGVVCLAMVALIAVFGTVAYLTDRDAETNVFTSGDVAIELTEDFEQGAELLPGVEITKKPIIENTGKNDAWVWLTFSIPSALDNFVQGTEQGSNENVIHWNPKGATTEGYVTQERVEKAIAEGFFGDMDTTNLTDEYINDNNMHWNVFNSIDEGENAYKEKINGVDYNTYVLLYNKALAPGEKTLPNIEKVFLDARVDIDPEGNWHFVENGTVKDIAWNSNTNGNPIIYVNAYAIQADANIDTVQEGYASYIGQWGKLNGENEEFAYVENVADLKKALADDVSVILGANITADDATSIEIPEGKEVTLDLNGHTLTNAVVGAPALVNNGTLTIKGDGAIVNGVSDTAKSHTVRNYGTLIIEGGNIGTDDTAGAAVVNDGTATINGGTFASKQEKVKSDGLCAYVFINNGAGTMTINDANFNGKTHGLFGAYNGNLIVNGGTYTMDGNGGLGCYVVYATGESTKVTLNGGTINTNEPRNGNVFFVYDKGNYFNVAAVNTGKIVVNDGVTIYKDGVEQTY